MKKATFTIGLFTVVTALTSFATPTTSTSKKVDTIITSIDGTQDAGGNRKHDFNGKVIKRISTVQIVGIDGTQDAGRTRKAD